MKTKITYIADDGTEFDNEKDCLAYENEKEKSALSGITFFDFGKNILNLEEYSINEL